LDAWAASLVLNSSSQRTFFFGVVIVVNRRMLFFYLAEKTFLIKQYSKEPMNFGGFRRE